MASTKTSTASPAQVEANRKNAQKSTGPRTEAGKMRSRMNALKHGLTGAGIALPAEDARQVEGRFRALNEEMAPQTTLGAILAHQVALMSVRMNRAARQESANLGFKVRHAADAFDEAQLADAEYQIGYIGCEPVTHRRRLLATLPGVDQLIKGFRELHHDLTLNRERWDYLREQVMEAYLGRRATEIPAPRSRAISQALQGNLSLLDPDDRATIEAAPSTFEGARAMMLDFLNDQIAELLRRREAFDFEALERDRAEAGERALFDASKDAQLARRYESAATREFYRALHEFREVERAGEITEPEPSEVAQAAREAAMAAGDAAETPPIPPDPADDARDNSGSGNDLGAESGSFGSTSRGEPAGPNSSPGAGLTDQEVLVGRPGPGGEATS